MDLQTIQQRLIQADTNYLDKNDCLNQLVNLLANQPNVTLDQSEVHSVVKLLRDFSHHHDPRVRSTALVSLLKLYENGIELDISLYGEFCDLLNDEYEGARITAMKLIQILSHKYTDCLSYLGDGEQIRMADDAFAKICSMFSDSSTTVRVVAASLLGKFTNVSLNFLHQTLDKKLMSNLRKKKSAHQRHKETFEAGEWCSGRKWANDAPLEESYPETINLMNVGACGAFIHGLEDEFCDVRMASLESLCVLAQEFPSFAQQSLDFLVDMFNDEIQEIRLNAIKCLARISKSNITLREDQIDIILAVLEDFSAEIREALHHMLANCKLTTRTALKSTIDSLIINLKRYPSDLESIWSCLQKLGQNNVHLTLSLVPELLSIHPFFQKADNSLDDKDYISRLIIIFNAAKDCPSIMELLDKANRLHYFCLKVSYPEYIPELEYLSRYESKYDIKPNLNNCEKIDDFFHKIFERIRNLMKVDQCSIKVQLSILSNAIGDLQKLAQLHSQVAPSCNFFSTYLQCQISLRKILSNGNWINTFLLSPSQSNIFRSSLQQLLSSTFTMMNCFHALHPLHIVCIQQTRVKAMALQLIAIVHGSNTSALGLCDAFLSEMAVLQRMLTQHNIKSDEIIPLMNQKISELDQPKPGTVARALQPLFVSSNISKICDLTNMLDKDAFINYKKIKMTSAVILDPRDKPDFVYKFTAGLVLELPFTANIENVKDIKNVRFKIQYPDQQTQLVQPKLNEFRPRDEIETSMEDDQVHHYRLVTKICISSPGAWSDSANIEISLLLDFRDSSSTSLSTNQGSLNKSSGIRSTNSDENLVIDICKPIRLTICPTKPKKLII